MKIASRTPSSWRLLKVASLFLLAFALQGATVAYFYGSEGAPHGEVPPVRTGGISTDVITQTFVVTNPEDGGEGSLRWAIHEANRAGGGIITFAFFEPSVITIQLRTALPAISAPMSLQGTGIVITAPFRPVSIDGRNVAGDLLTISSTTGITIEGLRFVNVHDGAVVNAHGASNVLLRNNVFESSRTGGLFEFTDVISIPFNIFKDIGEDAIAISDGVEDVVITANVFEDVVRFGVAAAGDPPPASVMVRDNRFVHTQQPIFLGPGANRGFPRPVLNVIDVITQVFIPEVRSDAHPADFAYPLTFDLYRVRDGEYFPLGLSFEYPETLFPAPLRISIPFGRDLRAGTSLEQADRIALLATTANPMTSEFSDAVPLILAREIAIDVKPGSDPNCVNPGSHGVVPVAILGSESFDVQDIDRTTLDLAGSSPRTSGRSGRIGSLEDVNEDGHLDLVVHFPTEDLDLSAADDIVTLIGQLHDGTFIRGTDALCIVPPVGGSEVRAADVPLQIRVDQNYPNPFNPSTLIRFQLHESRHVVVRVYDLLGQEIQTLVDRDYEPGIHHLRWDGTSNAGTHVASGVYVYTIRAGDFHESRRMILLR